MAKYISRRNPVSVASIKRRPLGTVICHHNGIYRRCEDIRFTRVHGGWLRERTDYFGLSPKVVSSAAVAAECNRAFGHRDSWARIY